eukprot:TRINITY_DN19616_c0_g1_i1.p1 TRINITY_DN19616_c0_g1~~TRINITY_DN19616_c0_g1_i1.p1  ORF type:complete len:263 (+),score=-36.63 TRINITY_DN19616_c0_g1_i1:30-818(+)
MTSRSLARGTTTAWPRCSAWTAATRRRATEWSRAATAPLFWTPRRSTWCFPSPRHAAWRSRRVSWTPRGSSRTTPPSRAPKWWEIASVRCGSPWEAPRTIGCRSKVASPAFWTMAASTGHLRALRPHAFRTPWCASLHTARELPRAKQSVDLRFDGLGVLKLFEEHGLIAGEAQQKSNDHASVAIVPTNVGVGRQRLLRQPHVLVGKVQYAGVGAIDVAGGAVSPAHDISVLLGREALDVHFKLGRMAPDELFGILLLRAEQ